MTYSKLPLTLIMETNLILLIKSGNMNDSLTHAETYLKSKYSSYKVHWTMNGNERIIKLVEVKESGNRYMKMLVQTPQSKSTIVFDLITEKIFKD